MRAVYAVLLGLYPAKDREIFAAEMMETFEAAAKEARGRGMAAYVRFAGRELAGLLAGLVSERLRVMFSNESYLQVECLAAEASVESMGVAELETRIERLIHGMEYAIAHHGFVRARLYSDQERMARGQLQRLLNDSAGR